MSETQTVVAPLVDAEVRPFVFTTAAINDAVQRALETVPDGHRTAFIATAAVDTVGAKMVIAGRMAKGWSWAGYVEHEFKGKKAPDAGAELRFSF